jgi:hypothetical protein
MGKTLPIENIATESAEVVSGACEQSKSWEGIPEFVTANDES